MISAPSCFLIDLDDTLYPELDYVESGYRVVAERLTPTEMSAEELFARLVYEHGKYGRYRIFNRIADQFRMPVGWVESAVEVYRTNMPTLGMYPHSREGIALLRQIAPVAIVTDGAIGMQRAKVNGLRLCGLVDAIVYTAELHSPKPSPLAFQSAADLLGRKISHAVVIGDDPFLDIVAAHAAACASVRVRTGRFGHVENRPGFAPEIEFETFWLAANALAAEGAP